LLSKIFNWYIKDLGKHTDIFKFLLHYLNPDDKAKYLAEHMDTIEVEYLFYDWNVTIRKSFPGEEGTKCT
jgi:hypothetical protein